MFEAISSASKPHGESADTEPVRGKGVYLIDIRDSSENWPIALHIYSCLDSDAAFRNLEAAASIDVPPYCTSNNERTFEQPWSVRDLKGSIRILPR